MDDISSVDEIGLFFSSPFGVPFENMEFVLDAIVVSVGDRGGSVKELKWRRE